MEPNIFDKVHDIDLKKTMEKSYIDYAMSVIAARALPDVRDGLKPVQRRVLYSMVELNNGPDKPHRKSARIVGDTMGKYHPHGDTSIYGALVNMAQHWSMRYMLVDGHGNFGSVDGDEAAAMRYTEARLSKISTEMLADIYKDTVDFVYMLVDGHGNFGSVDGDEAAAMRYTEARLSKISTEMLADIYKDTVDFVPNFDETEKEPVVLPSRFPNLLVNGGTGIAVGMATNIPPHNLREVIAAPNFDETEKEPVVLPSRFPNLLVNGGTGIAVGMATNIPPHNLREVIAAVVKIIDNKVEENRETTMEELLSIIKGPDFPTAATILGTRGIEEAYRTGRGKIKVRAVTDIETMPNGKSHIIVTELPYLVNKARLIEKMAELVKTKKIDGITAITDESNREGLRINIELRRDVNANVILNQLLKHTQLQDSFGVIMLALVNGLKDQHRAEERRQCKCDLKPALKAHPAPGFLRRDHAGSGEQRAQGPYPAPDAYVLSGPPEGCGDQKDQI